jgi:hypothetical protein
MLMNDSFSIEDIENIEKELINNFIDGEFSNFVLLDFKFNKFNCKFKFVPKNDISEFSIRQQVVKIIQIINTLKDIKELNGWLTQSE